MRRRRRGSTWMHSRSVEAVVVDEVVVVYLSLVSPAVGAGGGGERRTTDHLVGAPAALRAS